MVHSLTHRYSLQACCLLQLIKYVNKAVEKGAKVADEVALLFTGELNPVAPKAQKKVPVPDGYVTHFTNLYSQDFLAVQRS